MCTEMQRRVEIGASRSGKCRPTCCNGGRCFQGNVWVLKMYEIHVQLNETGSSVERIYNIDTYIVTVH